MTNCIICSEIFWHYGKVGKRNKIYWNEKRLHHVNNNEGCYSRVLLKGTDVLINSSTVLNNSQLVQSNTTNSRLGKKKLVSARNNWDRLLWECPFARSVKDCFLQEFDFLLLVKGMFSWWLGSSSSIRLSKRGWFLGLWGERNNKAFHGVERDPHKIWPLMKFNAFFFLFCFGFKSFL